MTINSVSRAMGMLLALVLVATSCSWGDDSTGPSAEELANDPANAPIDQIDSASGGVVDGPITGVLTVQQSFGFGVFEVDRATGLAKAVPGIASVATVDRNTDLTVSGGAAYTLGATTRAGQTFASDISIVKIDYESGQASQLAALGFDLETDDSAEQTSHRLEAVAGDSVVVSSSRFGSGESTFTVYDANTGNEKASFATPTYEFSSDGGSCSGGVRNLIGLSDGRVAGTALGSPAYIDLSSGEIELAIDCDRDDPELADFVTPDQISDYAIFAEGPAPTAEQIERMLQTDLNPEQGFVEGDGDLFWIEADSRQVDDISVTLGGVVQFDIASGTVEAVHPLGDRLGEYIECSDEDGCLITTLVQAQLRYLAGRLVMVDSRENGSVLTLDPATGAVTDTALELGDSVDFTRAELLAGDPTSIWLDVTRFTVNSDDEDGRSSSGPSFIEHFDLATNQIDLSLAADDLFF